MERRSGILELIADSPASPFDETSRRAKMVFLRWTETSALLPTTEH
jgi:hypothetical protein